MSPNSTFTKGKKRARNGKEKAGDNSIIQEQHSLPFSQHTPTCAQPPVDPSTSSVSEIIQDTTSSRESQRHRNVEPISAPGQPPTKHRLNPPRQKREKLPRLPNNAVITKRPIHRPAIPTPFSSSSSPKIVYITASSPFIPAIKRVRFLLSEIQKRSAQSEASLTGLKNNGRLNNRAVERAIAEESTRAEKRGRGKSSNPRNEAVYVKATGRAIQRALEIGVHFQKEPDCTVKVEIGSVRAIDDIELEPDQEKKNESDQLAEEDVGMAMEVDDDVNMDVKEQREKRKKISEQDVPETRVRSLSAVTVLINLK